MANEYKIQDWIDQYIRGELAGEALDKFKKMLREDKAFAEKVELQKILVEEIQEERKKELKAYISENAEVHYIRNIWGKTWTYASAAIVILSIGLYFVLQRFEDGTSGIAENQTEEIQEPAKPHKDQAPEGVDSEKHNAIDDHDLAEQPSETITDSNSIAIAEPRRDAPQIEIVEDDAEIVEDEDAMDEVVTLSDLKKEEDKLASDNKEVVVKDQKIALKSYPVTVLTFPSTKTVEDLETQSNKTDANGAVEIATERRKRKKLFDRNKQNTDSIVTGKDQVVEEETDETSSDMGRVATPTKQKSSLNVVFWKSSVGFRGYQYDFDKKQLNLYGISPKTTLVFKEIVRPIYKRQSHALYMQLGGTYFAIRGDSKFNKYKAVTDKELIQELSN